MGLVNICDFYCLADFELSTVCVFKSHDEAEERGLTRTVGADYADNAVGRQHEVEVGEECLVIICLGYVLRLDYLVAESRTVGYEYLQFLLALFLVFVEQSVVA